MSETTTDPQNTEPEASEEQHTPDPRNAEAAKYRKKLREAEAERDTARAERDALQATLDGQQTDQRHEAVRDALNAKLSTCSRITDESQAVLMQTVDPAKFLTDSGEVDQDAIDAYAAPLKPSWATRKGLRGWAAGGSGEDPGRSSSWKDLIHK